MKSIFLKIIFIIIIPNTFAQSLAKEVTVKKGTNENLKKVSQPKLETTIKDTTILKKHIINDSLLIADDYDYGEFYYFIQWPIRDKYDTIIVYFDESHQDTMIYMINKGYKNTMYKEWYPDKKLKTIESTSLGINKSWYPNGHLRWDKVVNADIVSFGYSVNQKNKSWYPDGSLMSETFVTKDSILEVSYYKNGHYCHKCYYYQPDHKVQSDDYYSPSDMYWIQYSREEFYCPNGQLKLVTYSIEGQKDYRTYYCNGQIRTSSDYYNNLGFWGDYREYYENGKAKIIGQYTNFIDNNRLTIPHKIGIWKFYSVDGNKIQQEQYDDDGNLTKE